MKNKSQRALRITGCLILLTAVTVLGVLGSEAKAAQKHKPVQVKLLAGNFGSSSYILGFATAKIINKAKHPWLTCRAVESLGSLDKLMMLEKMDPQERRTTIAFIADSTYYSALAGREPAPRKFTELRTTFRLGGSDMGLVTWDQNIKTPKDLIGKKIATYSKKSGNTDRVFNRMVGDVWGVLDKVKMRYIGPGASATAFGDHLVDAMLVLFYERDTPKGVELIPFDYWQSLYERYNDKLHYLGITEEDAEKASQITGFPYPYVTVPPKTAGPTQNKPLILASAVLGVGVVWEDADDDVIYEFIKTLAEHVDEYKYYLPVERPTKNTLPKVYATKESEVHPAALRYYKEQGLKVGIPGVTKR